MSDGALSQDEIDSLLAGLDPGVGGSPAGGKQAGPKPVAELAAFKEILETVSSTQGQNLSMITGKDVSFAPSQLDITTRDGMLPSLPDEVLAIRVDMIGGIPGDHFYLLPKECALTIASLAVKDETLAELDDMSISAVSEAVSSMTGTLITVFSEKTGNRTIQSLAAEGSFGPKAIAKFPASEFVRIIYDLDIGGQKCRLWEVYSLDFVRDIAVASGVKPTSSQAQAAAPSPQAMGQPMQQNQMPMGQMQMQPGAYQQPMYPNQMGMGQMQQGAYQQPFAGASQPNVQPVQFANLGMGSGIQESGNIGLIMDVYMELSVELGRTKKPIKEILGFGEGTIIELDKLAGEAVDILVNHKLIAKGEVVVIDENFGVRVTEIVSPLERVADLGG